MPLGTIHLKPALTNDTKYKKAITTINVPKDICKSALIPLLGMDIRHNMRCKINDMKNMAMPQNNTFI